MTLWEFIKTFKYHSFVVVHPTTKKTIKYSYDIMHTAEMYNDTDEDVYIISLSEYYIKSVDLTTNTIYLLTDRV